MKKVKENQTKKQVMSILDHFYSGIKDTAKMYKEKSKNDKFPQSTREMFINLENDCIKQILLLKTIIDVIDGAVK